MNTYCKLSKGMFKSDLTLNIFSVSKICHSPTVVWLNYIILSLVQLLRNNSCGDNILCKLRLVSLQSPLCQGKFFSNITRHFSREKKIFFFCLCYGGHGILL